MPIPVNIAKVPQENVWFTNYNTVCNNSTGTTLYYSNELSDSFFNSKVGEDFCRPSIDQLGTQHNETNKMFIKFSNLLADQYKAFSDLYHNLSLSEIESFTLNIISELISYSPDAFSLELTNEESIFYTFKKDDFSYYIQQYFETEDDGFNATLVTFKGDKKINSTNGNINNLLLSIEQKFSINKYHNINFEY